MNHSKYRQLIDNIYKELITNPLSESSNVGLHGGTSGIALFIAYYDYLILHRNTINPRIIDILEYNIQLIDSGSRLHTICGGISGFGWVCEHLRKLDLLKREDIEFLDDLDTFLYKKMMIDIRQGNYDYLHGALGVGTYFLSRFEKKETLGYLEELITELEESGVPCENNAIKWMSILDYETGLKGSNISLSHGMSSIAAFLIHIYQLNLEKDRVGRLLTQTIIYLLDQLTYTEGSISYFPSFSKENSSENYSRLGWCYGDLGIAYTLWRAAIVLKNEEWHNISFRILLHNSNRRDLEDNGIWDAGLCHGSAGVAHIFLNLYKNTKIERFRETADYWIDITKQMAKYDDGLVGFKAWRAEKYGGPVKSCSLLEGISGIGLALLSQREGKKLTWDECLMLS